MIIKCPRCGQEKEADSRDTHICVDCAKAENSRYTYLRVQQSQDWIAAAAQDGLDVWLQQPGETQWEYTVWMAYRDAYPGKKPTYSDVARQLDTTYNVVNKIARRWSFPTRMQAWITECDRITLAQRRSEILDMNAAYVGMAQRLRGKLSEAIDMVDPATLKPSDLNSLLKTAAELEKKARVDNIEQDALLRDMASGGENPELKKSPTKQSDLSEVVQILAKAGVLDSITHVGVRETTTTTREVLAANNDNSVVIVQEE